MFRAKYEYKSIRPSEHVVLVTWGAIAAKSIFKDYRKTSCKKKEIDSVTVEIQELSAAIGQINGLSAKMKLKYRQHNL